MFLRLSRVERVYVMLTIEVPVLGKVVRRKRRGKERNTEERELVVDAARGIWPPRAYSRWSDVEVRHDAMLYVVAESVERSTEEEG